MTTIVAASALSKRFGGVHAVREVDLEVREAEIVGLIGPNGAGKTTLFNMLCGTLRPTSGTVRVFDRDVTGWQPHRIASLGVARTFQITSIFPELTVRENLVAASYRESEVTFWGRFARSTAWHVARTGQRKRCDDILAMFNLESMSEIRARALSYGQQRRLEFAIALASLPKLLLLDEPAAGMNAEEGEQLSTLIQHVRNHGVTVLLVEHHMRVVRRVSDRVIVLASGAKIADGAPDDVLANETVARVYLGSGAGHA